MSLNPYDKFEDSTFSKVKTIEELKEDGCNISEILNERGFYVAHVNPTQWTKWANEIQKKLNLKWNNGVRLDMYYTDTSIGYDPSCCTGIMAKWWLTDTDNIQYIFNNLQELMEALNITNQKGGKE